MDTKLYKESFQTRKRELAIIVAALITLLPSVPMKRRKILKKGQQYRRQARIQEEKQANGRRAHWT